MKLFAGRFSKQEIKMKPGDAVKPLNISGVRMFAKYPDNVYIIESIAIGPEGADSLTFTKDSWPKPSDFIVEPKAFLDRTGWRASSFELVSTSKRSNLKVGDTWTANKVHTHVSGMVSIRITRLEPDKAYIEYKYNSNMTRAVTVPHYYLDNLSTEFWTKNLKAGGFMDKLDTEKLNIIVSTEAGAYMIESRDLMIPTFDIMDIVTFLDKDKVERKGEILMSWTRTEMDGTSIGYEVHTESKEVIDIYEEDITEHHGSAFDLNEVAEEELQVGSPGNK